jgi:hypothetical protein
MSGTMMTLFVRLLHLYFVVLLIIPHLGNEILHTKISSKRQRCRDERLSVDVEYPLTSG